MYRVYKIISPDISYRFERFIEMNEYVKLRSNRGKMVSLISIDRGRGYFRPTFFLEPVLYAFVERRRDRERERENEPPTIILISSNPTPLINRPPDTIEF